MRFPLKRWLSALSLLLLLGGCNTVVMNPGGDVASQEARLITISTVLMLLIIVPVIALTLIFAWRYRSANKDAPYEPDWDHSTVLELIIWGAPLLIIIALGLVTWISTHLLDPYRPLGRIDAKRSITATTHQPLVVQVVAMDWKWLFIYPEQGIATVNQLVTPIDRPIVFKLTATQMMNSFFVPALAGQIYAMPAMQTTLHAVMNKPGTYEGFSANYSGAGFSHMRFQYLAVNDMEFDAWVDGMKSGQGKAGALDRAAYNQLVKPSEADPVRKYASVEPGLFDAIVDRCIEPGSMCISKMARADAERARIVAELCREPGAAPQPLPVKKQNVVSNH